MLNGSSQVISELVKIFDKILHPLVGEDMYANSPKNDDVYIFAGSVAKFC